MALLLQLRQKLAQGFAALWVRYPNKSSKKDAEKAYGQVVTTAEIEEEVHAALDWQIPHWETLDWYRPPYLATYLRKERFRDEPPTKTPSRPIVPPLKAVTSRQMSQQEAITRIQHLMHQEGKSREEAVRQVSIEQGWIKE